MKLQATSKANVAAWKPVRKIGIVPVCESNKAKAERLLEVSVAKDRAEKAQAEASTVAGLCYDLFRKLLKPFPPRCAFGAPFGIFSTCLLEKWYSQDD